VMLTSGAVGFHPALYDKLPISAPYWVRPNGANHQWGKDPPKEVLVELGSLRASEPGNWPGRSLAIKPTNGG
jgi:hypothetical protein